MKIIDKIVRWVAFVNEVLQVAQEKFKVHFPSDVVKETTNETTTQTTTDELEK